MSAVIDDYRVWLAGDAVLVLPDAFAHIYVAHEFRDAAGQVFARGEILSVETDAIHGKTGAFEVEYAIIDSGVIQRGRFWSHQLKSEVPPSKLQARIPTL